MSVTQGCVPDGPATLDLLRRAERRDGSRRVGATLRQEGLVVNSKKVRRLMREHDLPPRRRRRFVATTDSGHDLPVFPNLARDIVPDGPNQVWNRDITYVAVASGSSMLR